MAVHFEHPSQGQRGRRISLRIHPAMILAALAPYKWLAIAGLVTSACAFSAYKGYAHGRDGVRAQWDKSIIEANAAARAREQAANFTAGAIRDDLTKARLDGDRAAGLASQRLRELAEVRRASATAEAACRALDAPAAAILRGSDVDALVGLARDADACIARLGACQRWATEIGAQ